jgi:hypothetical protein
MMSRRAVQTIALMTCLVFAVTPANAQQKKKTSGTKKKTSAERSPPDTKFLTGVKDLATLKDGAYEGDGWYSKYLYRSYSFVKRGSTITGFTANPGGLWCIQGTFKGNVIQLTDAVNWDEEYENGRRTGRYSASPLRDSEKSDFVEVRMTEEFYTFPVRRRGWLNTHPSIVARNENWMAGCLGYFSESHAEPEEPLPPPPCDDEQLRPAMKTAEQFPTYIDLFPTTICTVEDDPDDCTVENVFALLIENPAAIGPARDPEPRTVEDCSVLVLDSFTNLVAPKKYERIEYDNPIKVDIDEEHHRITNYTMPGHVFWPGLVIREIVLRNGKVGVKTTGYGHEGIIKKWLVNLPAAGLTWSFCDGVLIGAYKNTYGDDDAEGDDDDDDG